jgi:hypothetical protein|tara:strand:- start:568 stop:978 length:411 start_codon:yes stop_codon:yes gene_type:complete
MSGILQIVTSSNDEVITLNRHLGKCDLSLISAEMLVSGTQGDVARVQIEFLPDDISTDFKFISAVQPHLSQKGISLVEISRTRYALVLSGQEVPMWKNVDVPQTFSVKFFNDLNQGAIPSPNFDAALLTFSYSLRE